MTRSDSEPALCAVGNGSALGYLDGADLACLVGPTYSSPALCRLRWESPTDGELDPGIGYSARTAAGRIDVAADGSEPALTWSWTLSAATRATLVGVGGDDGRWHAVQALGVSGFVWEAPRGAPIFVYPSPVPHYVLALLDGATARVRGSSLELSVAAGSGRLTLVTGIDFAETLRAASRVGEPSRSRRRDAGTQAARDAIEVARHPRLPEALAEKAVDQILAQQSVDGGFMAGHRYALCYLRDQFGTCEGLREIGLVEPVRRNLLYRYRKWLHFGDLANAESMGSDAVRHRHENDDVELTGYLVLQATRYVDATGDRDTLREIAPMLAWCLERQQRHLVGGALPFNGDETYVAGGILPRWALNDGSMEATLLFSSAIDALARHRDVVGSAIPSWDGLRRSQARIRAHWPENFIRPGRRLVTNSLRRRRLGSPPASRPGVCENCGTFPTSTVRAASGRYVCRACTTARLGPPPERELSITSATLLPAMIPSPLVDESLLAHCTAAALARWRERGFLPPDDDTGLAVGYDEGLLLRALVRTAPHDRDTEAVAVGLASRADAYGTWSEYYEAGTRPHGTRCRVTLPLPLIALIAITGRREVMGDFVSGFTMRAVATAAAAAIIGLNIMLLLQAGP